MKHYLKSIAVALFLSFFSYTTYSQTLAHERCQAFAKGENLNNWLETAWDANWPDPNKYSKQDLILMQEAGLSSIRLPVAFHELVDTIAPYTVDINHPVFSWVDSVVEWTNELDMKLIIDNHHLWNLSNAEWRQKLPRFSHLWSVVANRYQNLDPDRVSFELLNEPTLGFDLDSLLIMYNDAIDSIRQHTVNHSIIVSPHWGSSMMFFPEFEPMADTNLIYTFHCYDPLDFTHQGFTWHSPFFPSGTTYPAGVDTSFFEGWLYTGWDRLLAWRQTYQAPIFLGEFGIGNYCDSLSTCRWLEYNATKLVQNNIPWFYWDWQWGFPMFQSNVVSEDSILPCFKYYLGLYGDDTFTDIDEISAAPSLEVNLFPNPTSYGGFTIQLEEGTTTENQLWIYTNIGQLIYTKTFTGNRFSFNEDLNSGIYVVCLQNQDKRAIKKLVVE